MTIYVKDSGEWKVSAKQYVKEDGAWRQFAGNRNVLTFNGVSQYAVAPRVEEIDLDDPNLEFEIEWYSDRKGTTKSALIFKQGDGPDYYDDAVLHVYQYTSGSEGTHIISLGGRIITMLVPYTEVGVYVLKVKAEQSGEYKVTLKSPSGITATATRPEGGTRTVNSSLYIGSSAGTLNTFYTGQLSNIKIWTGGDRNTGTLTRDYRMDEGWRGANNQVLVNYATELGEELVTVSLPYDTPRIGETGNPYNSTLVASTNLSSGTTVISSFSLESYAGSGSISWSSANPIREGLKSDGTTGVSASEIKSGSFYLFSRDTNEATVTDVSIKQADGYGTYIGLTETDWSEVTL